MFSLFNWYDDSGLVTKQALALFDKLQRLGTPSKIFLLLNDNRVLWFVGFETVLSDINLDTLGEKKTDWFTHSWSLLMF